MHAYVHGVSDKRELINIWDIVMFCPCRSPRHIHALLLDGVSSGPTAFVAKHIFSPLGILLWV